MPGAPGPGVVLDTWPLIEHYEGNEPAAAQVDELLARRRPWPVMSAVTFAEVHYTLANLYGASAAEEETRQLRRLLRVETLDIRTAEVAAWVKHTYRMSLGDTFAAAVDQVQGQACAVWPVEHHRDGALGSLAVVPHRTGVFGCGAELAALFE